MPPVRASYVVIHAEIVADSNSHGLFSYVTDGTAPGSKPLRQSAPTLSSKKRISNILLYISSKFSEPLLFFDSAFMLCLTRFQGLGAKLVE